MAKDAEDETTKNLQDVLKKKIDIKKEQRERVKSTLRTHMNRARAKREGTTCRHVTRRHLETINQRMAYTREVLFFREKYDAEPFLSVTSPQTGSFNFGYSRIG